MNNRVSLKGKMTATVLDRYGNPKRRDRLTFRMIFSIIMLAKWRIEDMIQMFRYEMSINHNIVTDEGDALIADLMSNAPARVKVDNTNGHIQVGTGWTGITPKTNQVCNTPTGNPKPMSGGYPQLKTAWGGADDNVTQYRCLFVAGDLNANGINEAALLNHLTPASADCLAYAEISPAVNVTAADTLQVDWELTFVGA